MKIKLMMFLAIIAFGGVFVLSGVDPSPNATDAKPGWQTAERQIKIVEETADYRLVKHALGECKIPREPRRIASLATLTTDSLVALGIKPVLVENAWQSRGPAPYLAGRLNGVPTVGRGGTVNIEAVLEAKPDLILAGTIQDGRIYSQLSKIAPMILFANSGGIDNCEGVLLDIAEIVGRQEQAARQLAEYHRRMDRAKEMLSASVGSRPVAFLRFRMQTCVIYSRGPTMAGPLLFDRLGLTPDPLVPQYGPRGGWDVLSAERLSMLKAEHLFIVVDADSEQYLREMEKNPLWRNIPAVKQGQVHRVDARTWIGGDGVLAYRAMIDDVLAAVDAEGSL